MQAVQKLVPYLIRDAQMQGAQKSRNEAYIEVRRCSLPRRRPGRLAAQRSRWAFFNSLSQMYLLSVYLHIVFGDNGCVTCLYGIAFLGDMADVSRLGLIEVFHPAK